MAGTGRQAGRHKMDGFTHIQYRESESERIEGHGTVRRTLQQKGRKTM